MMGFPKILGGVWSARIPLISVIAELRRVNRRGRCLALSEVVVRG